MAGFRQRIPVGLHGPHPQHQHHHPSGGSTGSHHGHRHDLEHKLRHPGGLHFQVGSDSYRLCRADAHPRAHANEEVIPPDAISLILELATLPGGHASLFSLLLSTILHHPLVLYKVRPSAPTPAVILPPSPVAPPKPAAKPVAKDLAWVEIRFQDENGDPAPG